MPTSPFFPPPPPAGSPGNPGSLIPLTGTGGLFTRVGALGALASAVNVARGVMIPTHITEINNQFETSNQDVINNLYSYLSAYQNSGAGIQSNVKSMASQTVVEMANQSVLLPNNNISTSLQLLISQMLAADQSVNACNVSASLVPYAYNIGNAVGVISVKNVNGLNNEDLFNETATATVVNDYQSSLSLAGVEPISIQSQQSISDTFSWLYPQGSGVSLAVNAVSALKSGGSGTQNWLQNGSFENYIVSADCPDWWFPLVGTPGSTIFQSILPTGQAYDGQSSVQYLGNGLENTSIYQPFSIAGTNYNTNAIIYPNLQFAWNLAIKMSATPPSGVLRISLSNASGPCSDNAGTVNSLSVNLNTIGTSWKIINGTFRTPNPLPSPPIFIELQLSTPLPGGYSLFIDHVAMAQMSQLYSGGQSVSFFSGNIDLVRGDTFFLVMSNDYGGKFQWLFDQMFNMKSLGLLLPSNATGGETIPDSLIM